MKNEYIKKETNFKKIYLTVGSVLIFILLVISAYFLYKRFTLSEDEAKDTANSFFSKLTMTNLSFKEFEDLYPNFSDIDNRVVPKKKCEINSISKNSNGDYEVYSSLGDINIFLQINKSNNKAIIKSSKGINYAYYNQVLDYGKKKGCLTGMENDSEMGRIIKDKNLYAELDLKTSIKFNSIYSNLNITNDIRKNFGMSSGNVTIRNENDFDLAYGDIDCTVEFYNANGNIVSSEKVILFDIKAQSSASSSVFCTSESAASFKIIPNLKNSDDLKKKIRKRIISETNYGCQ